MRRAALGWAAILAGSGLLEIGWRAGLGRRPTAWVDVAALGVLLVLLVVAARDEELRPLLPLVAALTAGAAAFVALLGVESVSGFKAWTDRAPDELWIPAVAALLWLPALATIGAARAFGFDRRQLFLVRGDVAAPGRAGVMRRRVSWRRLGPWVMLVFAAPLAVQLALTMHPTSHGVVRLAELLPLGLAFAAVNAGQEEVRFRAVPIGLALPVLGGERAIWMTATAFGLAHWYGHPSGPSGVVLALLMGLVLAQALVQTDGLFWPWAIHAVQDLAIFCFLVLSSG